VFINIVLNLILIPSHQAFGAAISSLVTQVFMALSQVFISIIKLRLISDYGYIVRLVVFVLLLFLFGNLAGRFMDSWFQGAILMILFSLVLMFLTKLLKIKDLYRIIRSNEENEEF